MNINKLDFEKLFKEGEDIRMSLTPNDINEKYEKGYSRIVTEQASYKIAIVKDEFTKPIYDLHPDYQRRITWNSQKRSKLIESFIINIPIPPIFLYEYDFDKYEIMDGLQRISTIIDFYNDKFKLTGLEEWPELNNLVYSKLPEKIRDGIDRRQLQVTILLKESAQDNERVDKIRRLVFERLNTGGVKLQGQEIRNALFKGQGNKLCMDLSEYPNFKKLWDIPLILDQPIGEEDFDVSKITEIDDEKYKKKLEKNSLYKRMYDVELVLRFFAMRHLEKFSYSLSNFLDDTLISLNSYTNEQLDQLKEIFISTIDKAEKLFGDKAFCYFNNEKWSIPTKMISDPLLIVLSQIEINDEYCLEDNIEKLKTFYIENYSNENDEDEDEDRDEKNRIQSLFDGKHQSKEDIEKRADAFKELIDSLKV